MYMLYTFVRTSVHNVFDLFFNFFLVSAVLLAFFAKLSWFIFFLSACEIEGCIRMGLPFNIVFFFYLYIYIHIREFIVTDHRSVS
jgi:hypothetical protein